MERGRESKGGGRDRESEREGERGMKERKKERVGRKRRKEYLELCILKKLAFPILNNLNVIV